MLFAMLSYGRQTIDDADIAAVVEALRAPALTCGPLVARFEAALASWLGAHHASACSSGTAALHLAYAALGIGEGDEVITTPITFSATAHAAYYVGATVRIADVDPATGNIDPRSVEALITRRTRAIVPVHLGGLPADMDAIHALARRHGLRVIEDCAHTLGATYDGRPVGTLGDAAIFSFQTLKPLNLYGGGLALIRDRALADRIRAIAYAEPWPGEKRITNRLLVGRLQRIFIKPWVFTISMFPILWVSAWIGANPDVYLWERIRRLDPLPDAYTERFPNVQAAIGIEALKKLDEWTERTRAHAGVMNRALGDLPGIKTPVVPPKRTHVYYQYCVYGPQRDELVVKCVRKGIDIETLHVDVCPEMGMFADANVEPLGCPGAVRAAGAMQVPVYASLTDEQIQRVAKVVRTVLS